MDGQEAYFNRITSDKPRKEGNIFAIKLNSTIREDKEYIISFSADDANVELYDFYNNEIYKEIGNTFFGIKSFSFEKATSFKLDNEENYYIISLIGLNNNNSLKGFFVVKLLFNSLDISSNKIISSTFKGSGFITTSSCFELKYHYIFCFFISASNIYNIIVYDYNLSPQKTLPLDITALDSKYFYKCVHFTEDVGAFLYLGSDKNFAFQFKEYLPKTIIDHYNSISTLIINNTINYSYSTKLCDMIKMTDKKFCFAFVSSDEKEFHMFIINNYFEENFKIRHYAIQNYNLYLFKIQEELSLSIYNGLITLVCGGLYEGGPTLASLIIFSYPNSTDFIIDISDNLTSFKEPIIKLYENCILENNIFGFIFEGIKIYNFTHGLKYIDFKSKDEIKNNSILSNNTDIELNLIKETNIEEGERIVYGMVAKESEYDVYNQ